MFDIGWSEFVLIAVVALIAIGPKELPGVLRMVGQWIRKARKMAAEFQGQFQEAMREAEMADLKQSFDEVREAASSFAGGNLMTSLQKNVSNALDIPDVDKPTETKPLETRPVEMLGAALEPPVVPTTPEVPTLQTLVEAEPHIAEAHAAATEPLAIVSEAQAAAVAQDTAADTAHGIKDAKAS